MRAFGVVSFNSTNLSAFLFVKTYGYAMKSGHSHIQWNFVIRISLQALSLSKVFCFLFLFCVGRAGQGYPLITLYITEFPLQNFNFQTLSNVKHIPIVSEQICMKYFDSVSETLPN